MTVGTQETEILEPVVAVIAVDVIEMEDEWLAAP
jgi:hypothetical protein